MSGAGAYARRLAFVIATFAALGFAANASASPYVQAHRGGSLLTTGGKQHAVFAEASMPAFRDAAKRGFVLELDVRRTADGVPLVFHDFDLERTTSCEGLVAERTAAEIRRECPIDLLGTAETTAQMDPAPSRPLRVPLLRQVLRLADRLGAEVNLEVKNVPIDPDYDSSDRFVSAVADEIRASGFPPSRMIVQSFWPPTLDYFEAEPYFELVETSLLTLSQLNDGSPSYADSHGYEWISPAWPVSDANIQAAHSLGLRVVPYTLDDPEDVKEATEAGVDAVISNDPRMARAAVAEVSPPRPPIPPPPSAAECAGTEANNAVKPVNALLPRPRAPRVFAIQFKHELRHVETYETFRLKMECLVRRYVVPRMADDRPNVIALNEDVGLMTLATGSRGAAARAIFADPENAPGCEGAPAPCGAAVAIGAVQTGYSEEIAAYNQRFPEMQPVAATFVAGTDTFARGWMQVFSDIARRYGVYILGSNNQSLFRESTDPQEISAFADPDLPRPESVYVATDPAVYNEVFMWGPRDVRREGPTPLRNVVVSNKKIPLTPIEQTIQLNAGPSSGPDAVENLEPYRIPGTRARVGFATSLPAFVWNGTPTEGFGESLPPGVDPCGDVSDYYMRCLDALGTNLVMQDEANSAVWTDPSGEGYFTPLVWMSSTWRTVADPTASFDYNVTPHMVGNLADLAFDGQTAITQRGLRGRKRCNYVGASEFLPDPPEGDAEYLRVYSGRKREFLGLIPWVAPDGPRPQLRETGERLSPGSGDELENDYIESAIVADLPFPPVARRANCKGA